MNAAHPVIQRPPNVRLDRCRENDLRNYMGINQEKFDLFKDIIEHYAVHKLPCVAKSRQKPEEWNEFLNTVNVVLPLQGKYVDDWHINAYFSILRRDSKIQRRWKSVRAEKATSLPSKKIKYIGKSPPSRRIITSPKKDRQRDDQALAECSIPPTPPTPPTQEDLPLPSRAQHMPSPSVSQAQVNYPAPCTTCGFLPPISSYHNKRLLKLFVNAEDLVPILNFIGILHDRHLLMVLNWPCADRVAFVNALRPDQVRPVDKQRLITLLTGSSSSSHVRAPNRSRRERQYDPIPKPPPDIERQLTSPDTPLSELMQAMTIRDEQQFDEILQAIDRLYGECAETSARDHQWWHQFFQKVYSEWPVMPLYREPGPEENNWAIKFYLRRKLSGGIRLSPKEASTSITPQEERHITGSLSRRSISPEIDFPYNPYSNSNDSQVQPYPGIALSTCPAHLPPDYRLVGQKLQNLLESHGSEELLPAFITAGIKTDQALISLSQLSKADRIKSFRQPDQPDLHLTDLQAFTLRRILHQL
ncbi:hypothetical protein AX14_001676 [Amanita brunnescens Koide BX004]|nr:hypothetical protein AX14_001676 [Amanita brunnescens Koide BX004]